MVDGPGGVGVNAEGGGGVLAEGADDGEVVSGAEFDFVDGPGGELAHFGDHAVDGVEADGVGGRREGMVWEAPELPDGLVLLFAPEVVGGLVEGAEGEGVGAEEGGEEGPEVVGIREGGGFDEGAGGFEGGVEGGEGVLGPGAGGGGFAEALEAGVVFEGDEEVVLGGEGAVGGGEGVAEGQGQVAEVELHGQG